MHELSINKWSNINTASTTMSCPEPLLPNNLLPNAPIPLYIFLQAYFILNQRIFNLLNQSTTPITSLLNKITSQCINYLFMNSLYFLLLLR